MSNKIEDVFWDKCLICGSKELVHLNRYSNHFLVRCRDCQFVFSSKKPSEFELNECYNEYSREDYLSEITIRRYNELLNVLESYRLTNRILDVGAGIGYFLEAARIKGWDVYGTEYTKSAVDICKSKGFNVHLASIEQLDSIFKDQEFDVITSFEVIEHINNPKVFVEFANKSLRKEGALYITTPNFGSFSRRVLKEEWSNIAYPEHLTYYTAKTLKKLLVNFNFKIIKTEITGISITRLKRRSNIKTNPVDPESKDEQVRQAFESNFFMRYLKKMINFLLNLFHLGDSLKIMAIKIK